MRDNYKRSMQTSASACAANPDTRILIVDDDDGIRSLVSSYLQKHGLRVDVAGHVAEMRDRLARDRYALIVLDLMMPGEDGLSALRALQRSGGPPVIMLSAVGTDVDRIVGLEVGAEDYLAKPCNPRELLARIRTVLRRNDATAAPRATAPTADSHGDIDGTLVLRFAAWRMDLVARQLFDPAGDPVALSDGEFRLLRAFVQHPRRVLTREQLMDYARGAETNTFDRAIDVQVSRLRRKLAVDAERTELIRTVRHEGYMFLPPVTRGH